MSLWYEQIQQQILDNVKAYDEGKSKTFQVVDIPDGYIYHSRLIIPTSDTAKGQRCAIDPKSPNCRICSYNHSCDRYNSFWG